MRSKSVCWKKPQCGQRTQKSKRAPASSVSAFHIGPSSVVGVEIFTTLRRVRHVVVRFSASDSDDASFFGFLYLSSSSRMRMRMGLFPSRETEPDQPR